MSYINIIISFGSHKKHTISSAGIVLESAVLSVMAWSNIFFYDRIDRMSSNVLFWEVGTIITIPLIPLPDVVLFPEETLPLRNLSNGVMEQLIRENHSAFAVILYTRPLPRVGTVVQISSRMLNINDDSSENSRQIVGKGRQRFKLHHINVMDDLVFAKIEILPEYDALPSPFPARQNDGRFGKHQCSYWNRWVYAQFDGKALVRSLQNFLLTSSIWESFVEMNSTNYTQSSGESKQEMKNVSIWAMTTEEQDPTLFSYWLASNLPVGNKMRQKFLEINSTVSRLRKLLHQLSKNRSIIQCASCYCTLSTADNIFSTSEMGAIGTFVNSNGFVHQMVTLKSCNEDELYLEGDPTATDSWFPDYAWTILYCRRCRSHLGWKFTLIEEDIGDRNSENCAFFYGLRRTMLHSIATN